MGNYRKYLGKFDPKFCMDQLLLGIGTRLQHTQHGQGVIVAVKYATYLVSFINFGIKEIDKTDSHLEEIFPENVSVEIETQSDVEKSLVKILQLWGGLSEIVPLGEKMAQRDDAFAAPSTRV